GEQEEEPRQERNRPAKEVMSVVGTAGTRTGPDVGDQVEGGARAEGGQEAARERFARGCEGRPEAAALEDPKPDPQRHPQDEHGRVADERGKAVEAGSRAETDGATPETATHRLAS